MGTGDKLHAFCAHLLEAAINDVLLQLELWNAVAKQAADAIRLLVDGDRVSCPAELLCRRETRRSGADDRDALAAPVLRNHRMNPSLEEAAFNYVLFVLLDRHR